MTAKRNWKINKGALYMVILLGAMYAMHYFRNMSENSVLTHARGVTMGEIPYNVKVVGEPWKNLDEKCDSVLTQFNNEFSTYEQNSVLSQFNRHDTLVQPSKSFFRVLEVSKNVYENTNGAFDPTVMPLVNLWGFGPESEKEFPDSGLVDSLAQYVGYEKILLAENILIKPSMSSLDFSAIAKGYAVDKVAEFLEQNGYKDYLVEIGGEVRCKGKNDNGTVWRIGIENPGEGSSIVTAMVLKNRSMATSGNYRNYREQGNRKVGHTIDPRTGYPVQTEIISATVVTQNCITADAYATSFMVLGLEKTKAVIEKQKLQAYIIYVQNDTARVWHTDGLKKFLTDDK